MNIIKLFIPKGITQEVNEVESWTVTWSVAKSIRWNESQPRISSKVFIDKNEADEFRKQLIASAKFINTPIETEINKN
jgi:hypothetical protein